MDVPSIQSGLHDQTECRSRHPDFTRSPRHSPTYLVELPVLQGVEGRKGSARAQQQEAPILNLSLVEGHPNPGMENTANT